MIYPKDITHSRVYGIVTLERMFSHRLRHRVFRLITVLISLVILLVVAAFILRAINLLPDSVGQVIAMLTPKLIGVALVLLSVWVVIFLLEAFFRSVYFKEQSGSPVPINITSEADLVDFSVARILYKAYLYDGDITKGFFLSAIGKRILLRLGVAVHDQEYFLSARTGKARYGIEIPPLDQDKLFGLADLTGIMLAQDEEFKSFLFSRGVKEVEFAGAATWVAHERESARMSEQWWSKERLAEIPGIGKDWAYGRAYKLERYAREVYGVGFQESYRIQLIKREHEVSEVERALLRATEANALLVGEPGTGKMEVVGLLAHRIHTRVAPPNLEHKHVMLLDTARLLAETGDKSALEAELINIMEDTIMAGNIVLVIHDLPEFITSARMLGSDVATVLDPYLGSSSIQLVATSDTDPFHKLIESNAALMKRFEKVQIAESDNTTTLATLERVAHEFESRESVFFTYPALVEIVNVGEHYITQGVMPDKAVNLMVELVPSVLGKKKFFITKSDVDELARDKTNIPIGEVDEVERGKLEHLEEFLHQEVIGQKDAVRAIASTMRRARAGVRNLDRPIGSFLFLGPTGVGKTQTAKALAKAFFGDEDKMLRLDMSEYQSVDALGRLIGIMGTNDNGTLATMLREVPYSVLLLDEFEKTNTDVHDLFLQILDEGYFTDAFGKKVNVRNTIIIATSNAGSDVIWEMVRAGKDLAGQTNPLIEELVHEGAFKPELLNRFDSLILFRPLGTEELKEVAALLLKKLENRLYQQNSVKLVVDDALLTYISTQGYNQSFGARPMNRFIQEHIEQQVAEMIISGQLREGMSVYLEGGKFVAV